MDESSAAPASHLTSRWKKTFTDRLIKWFRAQGRDLPWRRTRDPYAIWVSESMLQQTQVATVVDYYRRFLERFPSVAILAAADEQEVLRLWAGLGYYRRARQLHATAKEIVADFDSQMPRDVLTLQKLPGIGRYTAGAIASIAFDSRAPILEANTQRLYSRLLLLRDNLGMASSQQRLWEFASWILPRDSGSGTVNQAAMELGSLICKPIGPDCKNCPVLALCPSAKRGLQDQIPKPKVKLQFTSLRHVAVIIQRSHPDQSSALLMRCNPVGSWWQGLWDVPRVDVTEALGTTESTSIDRLMFATIVSRKIEEELSLDIKLQQHSLAIRHGVTRYRIQLDCYHAVLTGNSLRTGIPSNFRWVPECEIARLPLSSTAKRICAKLSNYNAS